MGAAPLYEGSKDPCTLIVPMGGMFQTISGSILKATTTKSCASKTFKASTNSGSLSFVGYNTGKLFSTAPTLWQPALTRK